MIMIRWMLTVHVLSQLCNILVMFVVNWLIDNEYNICHFHAFVIDIGIACSIYMSSSSHIPFFTSTTLALASTWKMEVVFFGVNLKNQGLTILGQRTHCSNSYKMYLFIIEPFIIINGTKHKSNLFLLYFIFL